MKKYLFAALFALSCCLLSNPLSAQTLSRPVMQKYAQPLISGQSFGYGSVVYVLELPGPGAFRDYEFSLCCGAPDLKGFLGNGFDYTDAGVLTLSFKEAASPCAGGCLFTGTFTAFAAPNPGAVCSEATGTLSGTLTVAGEEITAGNANYSQMMCGIGGVYWSSFGSLSVEW